MRCDMEEKSPDYMFFARLIGLAVFFVVLFKVFLLPFNVSGQSMFPTLDDGDRIFVNGLDKTPGKGQIIVFKKGKIPLVKRVAGVPGDTIEIDGEKTEIPEGKYYVLGDNSEVSLDSREFGLIDRKAIKGTMLIRIWPPTKLGGVK